MQTFEITVAGAGILGLWQALTLARAGHSVRLIDRNRDPSSASASSHAGAMLAPWCESESAPGLVRDFGIEGLELWRARYPGVIERGSLVVAAPRDRADLIHFSRLTEGYKELGRREIAELEPDLDGQFSAALYYPGEGHVVTPEALDVLQNEIKAAGASIHLGRDLDDSDRGGIFIDCRGWASRDQLKDLRGVRGERLVIRSREVKLSRPVRLVHPRHPLYIVPWNEDRFLVGATMIESDDPGPVSVRSALDLLGMAYAIHPAFGEAEILELSAGIRPAFPDNVPRARKSADGRTFMVNGAYRHGFLLAPVLAKAVADHLEDGRPHPMLTEL
jgi:glycine oxidase